MIATRDVEAPASPGIHEWIAVAALVLLAFALRAAHPAQMAVEHFDEGVYATRLWFADDAVFPSRHLYAPPLVPWLLRQSIDAFGPSFLGTMLPGVIAGTLTVALVWWTARRWFGTTAGFAALLLAAFSDFHIVYSRTALTDAPLALWLIAAVYCFERSFSRGSLRWAAAAGVFTALAWWTKYNGWLAAAIATAGLVAWLVVRRLEPKPGRAHAPSTLRLFWCWLMAIAVAGALWLPVLEGLGPVGGYAAVAENHRRYLVGVSGWWSAMIHHAGAHRLFDGWLTITSVAAALLSPVVARVLSRSTWNESGAADATRGRQTSALRWMCYAAGVIAFTGLAAVVGSAVALALLAAGGLAAQLVASRNTSTTAANPRRRPHSHRTLAICLVAAWFFGLMLATPFYRPYPRLSLPWLVSAWLGAAALVGWIADRWTGRTASSGGEQFAVARQPAVLGLLTAALAAAGILGLALSAGRLSERRVAGWQSRTGLETIAAAAGLEMERIAGEPPSEGRPPFVAYVYAQPALVFRLNAAGAVAQPLGDLGFGDAEPGVPVFLLLDPDSLDDPRLIRQWELLRPRSRQVAVYDYRPSDLVLLNELSPRELAHRKGTGRETTRRIGLYQMRDR
ncbi:MAG: glycosyltransferase family 39 protein [Planctomycetes bacterium]|nr:glycosyltransferase family 39 protein [Planctomycetota bacterium]